MIEKEFKSLLKNKGLVITMAIVLLTPILYAGTFLKSVWTPYDNTGNLKVGVVNLDNKVEFEGKTLQVGNSMVDKLKENKKVNWQFVDKEKAEKELREGDYYMVVTIPENFSKNATTLSSGNPEKMNIDFKTNFTKSKNGEKIMETVAANLTNTVKDQVVKTYSTTLYSKFAEIGTSLDKAADGSKQLSSGLSLLSEGGEKLSAGVSKLTNGAGTLSNGLNQLNEKKSVLIEGVDKLNNGALEFRNGLLQYTNGVITLNEKLLAKRGDLTKLADGGNTLSAGVGKLSSGIPELTNGAKTLSDGINTLNTGGSRLGDGINKLQEGAGTLSNGLNQLNEKKSTLTNGVNQLVAGSDKLTIGFNEFKTKSIMLASGVGELTKGSKELQEGLLTYTNGVLTLNEKLLAKKDDLIKLNAGGDRLNAGIDTIYNGIQQINAGLLSKQSDLNKLTVGGNMLEQGISELTTGAPKLSDGANQLSTGLDALKNGIPSERDIAAKKSKLNSTMDQLKGLKLTYRTNLSPLSSNFADLGAQIETIKGIISRMDTSTTTPTPVSSVPRSNNFTALKAQLASLNLPQEQQASILAAAQSDDATTNAQATPVVQPSANTSNNAQIKAELQTAINSASSKYSNAKYRVGRFEAIQKQLDKFDVNQLSSDLDASIDGFANIRSAVTKLSAGSNQLKEGLSVMNTKVPTLTSGFNQYKTGVDSTVSSLTTGALPQGLKQLEDKTPELKSGLTQYTNGVNALTSNMTDGELAQGVNKLATNTPRLQDGLTKLTGGLTQLGNNIPTLTKGIDQLFDGNTQVNNGLKQLQAKVPELSIGIEKLTTGSNTLYQGLTDMKAKAPELLNGISKLKTGSTRLADALSQMNDKTPELTAGFAKYKDGVDKLVANITTGELAQGVNKLADNSPKLQDASGRLADGISTLHGKTPELSSGIERLAGGSAQLYKGLSDMQAKAPELINGVKKAKDGSNELADRLALGAEKVNSAHTGDKNSDMLANPIKTNTSDVVHETAYGNAMAPFFLVFGLLIAAAAFNILFPIRKREYTESVNGLFAARLVSMGTFAILAVLIEVIAMQLFFDFKIEYFGMYFFGLILSALVFMIISHFLSYTFGKVGNGLNIGLVALQFVLTTPLFPKEMLPTAFNSLIPFMPVYYGDTAVKHAVLGGLTNDIYTSSILVLSALGAIFLILTYLAYNRKNKAVLRIPS